MPYTINTQGLIEGIEYIPSPNFNSRPFDIPIDLLVIHNISLPPGEFGGPYIDKFFTNTLDHSKHPYFDEIKSLRVSSHLLVRRLGKVIQYVPFLLRAWHAGESSFQGRTQCNDFSIGIELEGADDVPYTDAQYEILADLVVTLQREYPGITEDRIVGHNTIAPERKTDPGPLFDWKRLSQLVKLVKARCS